MVLELQQMEDLSLMGYPVILEIKTMNMIYQRQKKDNIQLIIMNENYRLESIFNALLQRGQGHLLVEAGPRLLESLLSAKLADEFIQIISPQKMEVGLSIINTEQSVVFSPPPPYVVSRQFNLAEDSVKIWKR